MPEEESKDLKILENHCFESRLGTYQGQTFVARGGEILPEVAHKFVGCLLGRYVPTTYIIFLNTPFEYGAITKQAFETPAQAQSHLEDLLKNLDMTKVLNKGKYSSLWTLSKTADSDFYVF